LATELSKLNEKLDKVIVSNHKMETNIKQLQGGNEVLKDKVRNVEAHNAEEITYLSGG
jgi:phage shock protein A